MIVTHASLPVAVAVLDYTQSATTYQQVARNEEFAIRHHADGTSMVSMPLLLDAYAANEDGTRGELLAYVTRRDVLVSDMSRAVDYETGAMRYQQLTSIHRAQLC